MIRVHQITKSFPISGGERVQAVEDISFLIPESEFFTILGPSGCGKTTLLRTIAGLAEPENGEIFIDEVRVFSKKGNINIPPYERDIGMVFQSYAIWPHMTVFENVAFPLKVSKTRYKKSAILDRVEGSLRSVHLDGYLDRPATNLSGGQQQRLALARALVREPKVLLLDEPLSNLDAKLREKMRTELRHLHQKLGITTIYVTHDQTEALAMSDRIAIMDSGRIIQKGNPRDIYDHPTTASTAGFIGSTNFIEGEFIKSLEGELRIVNTDLGELVCQGSGKFQPGDNVLISIRPQNIQLLSEMRISGVNHLSGIVREIEFLGEHLDCQVVVDDVLIKVFVNPQTRIHPGEQVNVVLPEEFCTIIP
jgi:iron(III) transport system ATP-binding protein